MRFGDAPATHVIAVLTIAVSAALILFFNLDAAAIGAGFVPARVPDLGIAGFDGPVMPVWLTPITAALIHGGWVHLIFNMVMLVYCGRETERALGSAGVLSLYLVGAYAAALGQWAQAPGSAVPMIGASGAISAIIAAYALLYGRSRAKAFGPVPAGIVHALWLAAAWIGINLLIDYAMLGGGTIAIGAHIGGFLAGLLLARPILLWRYRRA